MQSKQGAPRHGHVAYRHWHIADHPGKRGLNHKKALLGLRRVRLRLQRLHLRLCCVKLRLGSLQRGLADVLLLQQLLLALKVFARHRQAGARSVYLGGAGLRVLARGAGVNARQLLPRAHRVAHFD